MFASMRANVITVLYTKDFWLGRGNAFDCRPVFLKMGRIAPMGAILNGKGAKNPNWRQGGEIT